jgi:dienelactone hydrolase
MLNQRTRRYPRQVLRLLLLVAALGVLGLVVVLGSLEVGHETEVALPVPTGPLPVGRVLYDWTGDQPAALAPASGTKRELLVWIWYPADVKSASVLDDYRPVAQRTAIEHGQGALLALFSHDLSRVRGHSFRDVDLSRARRAYPVVLMRAGGSLEVAHYSTLAEDLASHGYVVVGFDAPYRTFEVAFPDGRVIERRPENNPELCLQRADDERERCATRVLSAWTTDMSFVLDRLERLDAGDPSSVFQGRLDLTRVGAFGHSFGGAASALFCHDDPRCKAGIDVDGAPHGRVIRDGLDRPFMFVLGDHSREGDPESRQVWRDIGAIYDRLPADGRVRVVIRGANHFFFSDDAVLRNGMVLGVARAFGAVRIDGRRQLAIATYCVHTFFDKQLKGEDGPSVETWPASFPEIQLLP